MDVNFNRNFKLELNINEKELNRLLEELGGIELKKHEFLYLLYRGILEAIEINKGKLLVETE